MNYLYARLRKTRKPVKTHTVQKDTKDDIKDIIKNNSVGGEIAGQKFNANGPVAWGLLGLAAFFIYAKFFHKRAAEHVRKRKANKALKKKK